MNKKRMIWISAAIVLGIISLFFDKTLANFFVSLQNPLITSILNVFEPTLFVIAFGGVMIVFSLWKKKKNYILPIFSSLILATLISYGLKFIFMRARPFNFVEYIPFLNLIDYSFPSSHCVAMFAMLPILDKEFKNLRYLWLAVALIVAFTRLYFGVHYLSDVIFGSVIGYLIGLLIVSRIGKKTSK